MVNLPRTSLRIVYELIITVDRQKLDISNFSLMNIDFCRPSPDWHVMAHTYMTVPATCHHNHLNSKVLSAANVQSHFEAMLKITQDIQSRSVYADPSNGRRYVLGGDWIHAQLDEAGAVAKLRDQERFLHC